MMEAWLSSSDSTASSGPSRTCERLVHALLTTAGDASFCPAPTRRVSIDVLQTARRWRRNSWRTGCSPPAHETRPASAPDSYADSWKKKKRKKRETKKKAALQLWNQTATWQNINYKPKHNIGICQIWYKNIINVLLDEVMNVPNVDCVKKDFT